MFPAYPMYYYSMSGNTANTSINLEKQESQSLLCWQFNISQILMFTFYYTVLCAVFSKNKKGWYLASNIVSCITCWRYLYYQDVDELVSYYWYDLILMITKRDRLMVAHHLFTLYGISHCDTYVDYENVIAIVWMCKLSDVFVHQHSIVRSSDLPNRYPIFTRAYQIFTLTYTVAMWSVFRVGGIIMLIPSMESLEAHVLLPIFVVINIYWIIKYVKLIDQLFLEMIKASVDACVV